MEKDRNKLTTIHVDTVIAEKPKRRTFAASGLNYLPCQNFLDKIIQFWIGMIIFIGERCNNFSVSRSFRFRLTIILIFSVMLCWGRAPICPKSGDAQPLPSAVRPRAQIERRRLRFCLSHQFGKYVSLDRFFEWHNFENNKPFRCLIRRFCFLWIKVHVEFI